MKTFKIIVSLLVVIIIAAAAVWIVRSLRTDAEPPVKTYQSKIADVSKMAELCSVEIYTDIPLKESIGHKHIFARQTLEGNITFPIDSLRMEERGDTTFVWLPKEKVRLLESTAPKSFEIIDTWSDSFFVSGTLTAAEENRVKVQARDKAIKRLYADGTVSRARKEARVRLATMLNTIWQTPVAVIDAHP